MTYSNRLRKVVSIVVIIAFVFYGDIFLYSQSGGDIDRQFEQAKAEYNNGQYANALSRTERMIGTIKAKWQDKRDMLGQCYLLLGAIYEKEEDEKLAEENYLRAKNEYGIESIDGVDLSDLSIYKRVVKGEFEIDEKFLQAKNEYINGLRDKSKATLEEIIANITENRLGKKEILGKCYLLLGAIYEKAGETFNAEENYLRAKNEYGIESIDGVEDLSNLTIYKRVVRGIIEYEGPKKKKKKFPWLWVIGGMAVIVTILVLLKKKGNGSQDLEFIADLDSIEVPEGGTATFNIRLSAQPSSDVSAGVVRISGDTDIYVQSSSSLMFTTSNWNQNQTVRLAAKEDSDTTNGTATIRIIASGVASKDIIAHEQEYSTAFVTNTDSIIVPEKRTAAFEVWLSQQPTQTIYATVSKVEGDEDINIRSGGNLTFTSSNWNTHQTVTIGAEEDLDAENGDATFKISASDMADKNITATEDDKTGIGIKITYPYNGATVQGTCTIKVTTESDVGVRKVRYWIDYDIIGEPESPPFSIDWDTTKYSNGTHTIRAVAHDNANRTIDDQITVTVNNGN